nr:hypothetical protein [Tanacetum cinerariifolium]
TLVDMKKEKEVVAMDPEPQGRITQEDVSAAEPTIFDDEELHNEEVQTTAAREKQEKADMKSALELQRQYDDKEENIDWSAVAKEVSTFFKPDKDAQEPQKKRVANETLLQESFKKLKAVVVLGSESTQEIPSNELKEMTKEDVQNILKLSKCQNLKLKLYRSSTIS